MKLLEGYVAKYLRISDDDEDRGVGKQESDSIGNQRKVLEYYIKNHRELSGYPQKEFLDDGFSGVSFQRPGVQKLLKEVKEKRIACIVVKDLSRFGRNYIEVGDYIEQIFPFLGVRFISVSDQYDSFQNPVGIEIGFKSLIHDLYSRDLSKKIKSVKRLHQEQGRYSGGDVPYGYQKGGGKEDRMYYPELEAAHVVKQIFRLALDGNRPVKIAEILSREAVPTPGVYKNQMTGQNYMLRNQKSNLWTPAQIREILQNEVYVGTYICHKLTAVRPREMKRNDRSEYIRFENHHEPLIAPELFRAAQKVIQLRGRRGIYQKEANPHVLKGKVKCGQCGYGMLRRGKQVDIYYCHMGNACGSHMKIQTRILEQTITILWKKLLEMNQKDREEQKTKRNQTISKLSRDRAEKRLLEMKAGYCKTRRMELYDHWKEGKITKEDYLIRREKLMGQEAEYRRKLNELDQEISETEAASAISVQVHKPDLTPTCSVLTKEMVDEFIERIDVYGEDRIEVIWKFQKFT